jgi:hypothetical protein
VELESVKDNVMTVTVKPFPLAEDQDYNIRQEVHYKVRIP